MRYGLTEETLRKIEDVFRRHAEVDRVILYGSRAKGTFRPGSDIDLTLQGGSLRMDTFHRIRDELDELNLPYTFDLSLHAEIENRDLLDHIERVGSSTAPARPAVKGPR